jgi:hypothetical protein
VGDPPDQPDCEGQRENQEEADTEDPTKKVVRSLAHAVPSNERRTAFE